MVCYGHLLSNFIRVGLALHFTLIICFKHIGMEWNQSMCNKGAVRYCFQDAYSPKEGVCCSGRIR